MAEKLYSVYVWDYNRPSTIERPIVYKNLPYEDALKLIDDCWARGASWDGYLEEQVSADIS